MSIKRLVLGMVILSSLLLTAAAFGTEASADETGESQPATLQAETAIATPDSDTVSEPSAGADCEAANESISQMPPAQIPFETGDSQISYAGGKECDPWIFLGCCSNGTKKWQRKWCCVGPDCFWEYSCAGICPR